MATIPQYNRSVAPQDTPLQYIQTNATPDTFGAGVARAAQGMGEAALNFSEGIADLKVQYDKTKLFEFSNNIDTWSNDNLYDKDKGYFSKVGKEAMGKSPEVMDSYDKYVDKYISDAGFMGGWAIQARRMAQDKRNNIERLVETHDKKQSDAWQDAVYTDAMTNIFNKGIQGRNNDADIARNLTDGYTVLSNYGAIKGWGKDPEMMAIKKKEFEGNYYGQILDAYIAENSLKASAFFNKYKDKFNPEAQNKYLARIHEEEINYKARATANNLVGLSTEQAYKYIDGIKNLDERDAVEREYNRKVREKETIKNKTEKDALDNFYKNALAKTQRGEALSYDDIPAGVDAETKLNLMRYINSNGAPENDDNVWQDLYDKSVNDAQGFLNIDLNKYRGALSDGEYKSFVKRQNDIRTGNYYTQIKDDDAMIDSALQSMGLGRGKKENVAYSEIRSMVRELETRRGRKINDGELQSIVNSLGYKDSNGVFIYKQIEKGMAERTGFIRDIMNDFTYYQNQHKGAMPSNEEKAKIINRRVNSVIIKQNNNLQSSLGQTYQPKVGDIWNGHKITSVYGKRTAPTKGATTDHKGVDLAFQPNEIFPAYASGTVSAVGKSATLGNYVDIRGYDGTIYRYGHANSITVKKGQTVRAGQGIGRAGSTGVSTGTHVHFAKIKNGNFVNPLETGNTTLASNGKNKGWAF